MARAGRVSSAWTGWVGFAGIVMIVIGALNFFERLIAVIRGCGRSPCWR